MSDSIEKLLTRLEESRTHFGHSNAIRVEKILASLAGRKIPDADSLVRLHESLLFLRAHPQSPAVKTQTEGLLSKFHDLTCRLRSEGADLYSLDYIENSGIAGTAISGTFSYGIVCWLVRRYPGSVDIDWNKYAKPERIGLTLARFLPLLFEDTLVEANIPYKDWLRAAIGKQAAVLEWLIARFEALPIGLTEQAELYDALEVPVRWELGKSRASRTHLRRPVRTVFYHSGPFIQRRDVSLSELFNSASVALDRLSEREGERILDMVRTSTTVRYRELYGITHGDPKQVIRAGLGRGVEVFLWGLPQSRRLPIRAYHAGFTLKNGVPINYIEAITLFERTEVGFNTFYTFREGESAWVYGQVLRLLNQVLGVTCISIDPYQIGLNNDEAIESGAFWFYRKLGFRPTRRELATLAAVEEKRVSSRPGYRTSRRVLKKLSQGNMVYEAPGSRTGDWDRFHQRNIGLAVNAVMGRKFNGEAERMRAECRATVVRSLGIDSVSSWNSLELKTLDDFAVILALVPELSEWPTDEKEELPRLMRAKAAKTELQYLKTQQGLQRLRKAIIRLGSVPSNDNKRGSKR